MSTFDELARYCCPYISTSRRGSASACSDAAVGTDPVVSVDCVVEQPPIAAATMTRTAAEPNKRRERDRVRRISIAAIVRTVAPGALRPQGRVSNRTLTL